MLKGLFVYKKEDELKLKWFIKEMDTYSQKIGVDLKFITDYNLMYGYIEGKFRVKCLKLDITELDFVINYARNPQLAKCFELMGIRVINNSQVSTFCQDKAEMHFAINGMGIKSDDTYFVQKTGASLTHFVNLFPLIVKTTNGYGGEDVHLANEQKELVEAIGLTNDQDYIIQKFVKNYNATSIRIFVLGGKIFGAVKRLARDNFKTYYGEGCESFSYTLNPKELVNINKIIKLYDFDLVAIDFVIGYGDEWYFNEVESIITGRELFDVFNISLPEKLLDYITKNVKKRK